MFKKRKKQAKLVVKPDVVAEAEADGLVDPIVLSAPITDVVQAGSDNVDGAEGRQYAGLSLRLWANLLDALLGGLIGLVPALPGMIIASRYFLFGYTPDWLAANSELTVTALAGLSMVCMYAITFWLYPAVFESSAFHATPGKLLLGMQVQNTEGKNLTFWAVSMRLFLQFLLFSLPLCIFGAVLHTPGFFFGFLFQAAVYGTILLTRKHQTIYDLICHRVVLKQTLALNKSSGPSKRTAVAVTVALFISFVGIQAALGWAFGPDGPVCRPMIRTSREWSESPLSKINRYLVCDKPIAVGEIVKANQVRVMSLAVAQDQPPTLVALCEIVGKPARKSHLPGDFLGFNDLSNQDAEAEQKKLMQLAKAGKLSELTGEPCSSAPGFDIFLSAVRANDSLALTADDIVAKPTAVKLSLHPVFGFSLPVTQKWEVLGKKVPFLHGGARIFSAADVEQTGIAFKTVGKLPAGHVLQMSDLVRVSLNPQDTPYSTVSDVSLLVGKRLLASLGAGTVINAQHINWSDR